MATHYTQGAASAAPTFDARLWLDAFASIGGGYALTSDRRLCFIVADCEADKLAPLMSEIIGQVERQDALKLAIVLRSHGEVAQ